MRGVWPAIEGDDPADHEVESFLTHARRSVMKDRISKKDQRKNDNYRNDGSLAKLGALGAKRKEPTGCNSIIEMHKAESFRIHDSFKTIPMGSAHSPAAIYRHQLAQVQSKNEQSTSLGMSPHVCGRQSAAAGASGFPRGGGPCRWRIGASSLSRRRTRTRAGRCSKRARVPRVGKVRQLREPTFGTSLGSERPQCWSKDHFHKRVTCVRADMCRP
jgi:hypothetical protein